MNKTFPEVSSPRWPGVTENPGSMAGVHDLRGQATSGEAQPWEFPVRPLPCGNTVTPQHYTQADAHMP